MYNIKWFYRRIEFFFSNRSFFNLKWKLKYIFYTWQLVEFRLYVRLSQVLTSFVARNLGYWFVGTSYFVYVDVSDGDYGCSFFFWSEFYYCRWMIFISINVHRSCFVSRRWLFWNGVSYSLFIIAELVIKNVMRMEVYEYLGLFMMLRG
jgi:hypothetical protein